MGALHNQQRENETFESLADLYASTLDTNVSLTAENTSLRAELAQARAADGVRVKYGVIPKRINEAYETGREAGREEAELAWSKLAHVRDWIRFAANSDGGIAAEIDEVFRERARAAAEGDDA